MQPVNQKRKAAQQKGMLNDIVFKYIPYWPVFVILMAVSMFGAWFYLRITPKMFDATAKIAVKDEQKGYEGPKMQEEMEQFDSKKIIENEVEVVKSNTLMSE